LLNYFSKDSNKNIVYNNCCNMNLSKKGNSKNMVISMNNNVIPLDNLKSNSIPNNFNIKSNFDSLHDLLDLDKFKNNANSNLSMNNQIFDLVKNIDSNLVCMLRHMWKSLCTNIEVFISSLILISLRFF